MLLELVMLFWCLTHDETAESGDQFCWYAHGNADATQPCEIVGLIRTDEGLLFADRCNTCDGTGHAKVPVWPCPDCGGKDARHCSGEQPCPAGCVNGWTPRVWVSREEA